MNKPYSFSIDQMNGIVEDTYAKIINECENLIILPLYPQYASPTTATVVMKYLDL